MESLSPLVKDRVVDACYKLGITYSEPMDAKEQFGDEGIGCIIQKVPEFNIDFVECAGYGYLIRSEKASIYGIDWWFELDIHKGASNRRYMSLDVKCSNAREARMWSWSCRVRVVAKLVNHSPGEEGSSFEKEFMENFHSKSNRFGWSDFADCEFINDNGFVKDDTLTVVVLIVTDLPSGMREFEKPDVITVNKTRFSVNQYILAAYSDYFRKFFFDGNFREASENSFEINDPNIDAIDFRRLLETIQPMERALDDECVERVLRLAHRFLLSPAIDACERFLLKRSRRTVIFKFRMAEEYNLPMLRDVVLEDLRKEDFSGNNFLENLEEVDKLDEKSRKRFYGRYYELYPEVKKRKVAH